MSRKMLALSGSCLVGACVLVAGCDGGSDDGGGSSLAAVAQGVVAGSPCTTAAGFSADRVPHLVYPSGDFHGFQTMDGDSQWVEGEEKGTVDPVTALPVAWLAPSPAEMQYAVGWTETHERTGRTVTYENLGACEFLRTILDITFYDARTAAPLHTVRVIGADVPFVVVYNADLPPRTVAGDVDYDDVVNAMRPFVER